MWSVKTRRSEKACLAMLLLTGSLPRFGFGWTLSQINPLHSMSRADVNKLLGILPIGSFLPQAGNPFFNDNEVKDDILLPLRFLPFSGGYALLTTFLQLTDDDETPNEELSLSYFAIVDTGSPFLTAPSKATTVTRPSSYHATDEQYAESVGGMDWREADLATWIGTGGSIVESTHAIVGIASDQVIQETGGIFVGLIDRDDNHPTFWQQLPTGRYRSFQIVFDTPSLRLSQRSLVPTIDSRALKLFDLSAYGPDLYHYAIECSDVRVDWQNGTSTSHPASAWSRPVVVILDTGLTGCILSSSLQEDLGAPLNSNTLQGLSVALPTIDRERCITLSANAKNNDKYWRLACFRLPWFDDESNHPHIIALGAMVWASGLVESLTVDLSTRRARIQLV